MHDFMPADRIEPAAFRRLAGQFATGVCVVAAHDDRMAERTGERTGGGSALAGITVNSFVSVSLDPLLVAWSLQNTSSQFDLWSAASDFTISILGEDQHEVARRYAVRGSTALQASDFAHTDRGLPVIAGALGYIECRQWSLYPAGDHTLVFGEVIGIGQASGGRPLGYYGGAFCRIAE